MYPYRQFDGALLRSQYERLDITASSSDGTKVSTLSQEIISLLLADVLRLEHLKRGRGAEYTAQFGCF